MDRVQYIKDELGVALNHEYVYEDRGEGRQRYDLPDIVASIDLGLTPTQWCMLAMREPPEDIPSCYVGGCCGNMGYVQDIINGAFRDGGFIEGSHLLTVGKMMRDHDGTDSYFKARSDDEFKELVGQVKAITADRLDPWAKIGVTFLACEEALDPNLGSEYRPQRYREDYPEDQKAYNLLLDTLQHQRWANLFAGGHGNDEDYPNEDPERRKERKQWDALRDAKHDASRVLNFAKMLEPLRRVHELTEARDDVFEGWALIDPETRQPLETGGGQTFFYTREDAQWLVALWERDARMGEERDIPEVNRVQVPAYEIVPVTISIHDGLMIQG